MVQFVGDALKYFKMIKQSDVVRKKYIDDLSAEFAASTALPCHGGRGAE